MNYLINQLMTVDKAFYRHYLENLGSPQQHGHLPGGEGLDAVQGEQHFQIMTVEGFVHG